MRTSPILSEPKSAGKKKSAPTELGQNGKISLDFIEKNNAVLAVGDPSRPDTLTACYY